MVFFNNYYFAAKVLFASLMGHLLTGVSQLECTEAGILAANFT